MVNVVDKQWANIHKKYFSKNILNLVFQDETAESLIYLPGFNVSPAPECKSKK